MLRALRKKVYKLEKLGFFQGKAGAVLLRTYASLYRAGIFAPKADINIESVISNKYKFIYVGIPKVATRTLIKKFIVEDKEEYRGIIIEQPLVEILKNDFYKDFYIFSIVRHPVTRILSCYQDKILNPGPLQYARVTGRYAGLEAGMPFEAFVDWLLSPAGADEFADRHWISQYRLISDKAGNVLCDYVGRLENLEASLSEVAASLKINGMSFPTRKRNASSGYVQLSQSVKEKIYRRYQEDFRRFHYEIE